MATKKEIASFKEASNKVNSLLDQADKLRAEADKLEHEAGKVVGQAPAAFIEPGRALTTKIYVSASCTIGNASTIESLGKYDNFIVLEVDKTALEALRKALEI